MKRTLLLIAAVILIVVGLFLLVQVVQTLRPSGQGALQVTANIKSQVFLGDELVGETPLCKCEQNNTVKQGEYTLKIVPEDKNFSSFVAKIKVEPGVLTAVERTFLPGSLASAYILTLEKSNTAEPQLFVGTLPDSAMIAVDSTPRGVTPFVMDSISASEHEIEIQKDGYAKKTIRVRTVPNYKLVVSAFLGTESGEQATNLEKVSPTPTPTDTENKEKDDEENEETTDEPSVEILQTSVGFLRVREEPSTASDQITTVSPGEVFPYTETDNGWYKITLKNGTEGWVSGQYVRRVSQ